MTFPLQFVNYGAGLINKKIEAKMEDIGYKAPLNGKYLYKSFADGPGKSLKNNTAALRIAAQLQFGSIKPL